MEPEGFTIILPMWIGAGKDYDYIQKSVYVKKVFTESCPSLVDIIEVLFKD